MDFDLELAIDVLSRTPRILEAWLSDLPDDWVISNGGKDAWSPFDVVGHLIHGERTDWIPRAKIILSNAGTREFKPFDRFAQFEDNKEKSVGELLRTFAKLREENLSILRGFDFQPSDYQLKGKHPELGAVTLKQLLSTWVVHDLNHLGQIAKVMAKQYKEAVGPWKAYLSILEA
jgi:hypothetical protein